MTSYHVARRHIVEYELIDERGNRCSVRYHDLASAERAVRRLAILERIDAAALHPTTDPQTCRHPEELDLLAENGVFYGCTSCGRVRCVKGTAR